MGAAAAGEAASPIGIADAAGVAGTLDEVDAAGPAAGLTEAAEAAKGAEAAVVLEPAGIVRAGDTAATSSFGAASGGISTAGSG